MMNKDEMIKRIEKYVFMISQKCRQLSLPAFCNCRKKTSESLLPVFRSLYSMQEKRLELSWYCYHTDLNRARLPIPPFLHASNIILGFANFVNYYIQIFLKKIVVTLLFRGQLVINKPMV